ncbi:upstream activation factor subunit spp27-like [Quillaja saponaria]|uniref:Upstream activation factor subunit spp27-like n=1 Tax=Quillaja saponaria TaxID=32244 RepID=A0AAD7P6V7_QUISA|nr:upstream activation factor subunit spp27-like [Quillaja saponaria]
MASTRVFGACRALMAAARGSASGVGSVAKTTTTTKTPSPTGIKKPVPVSSQLGKFLGSSQASRTDAVKKVWEYIKLHNLQNPANKREIFCDEKLKTIFDGKDAVGFTEIAKLLSKHFVKSG